MHFAVLGTGDVGKALASGLARHGHRITMGTRDPAAGKLDAWVAQHGVGLATFADAAREAEGAILCTSWQGVENAVQSARGGLKGKLLIDVTNPLEFTGEGPPTLAVSGKDSAGETVQRLAPEARVVKCWNIVGNPYMVDPDLPEPTMFIAGEDDGAKQEVRTLLEQVGWPDVVDLGGIEASRYLEALAMVWIRTFFATGNGQHAFRLVRHPEISTRTV